MQTSITMVKMKMFKHKIFRKSDFLLRDPNEHNIFEIIVHTKVMPPAFVAWSLRENI